MSTTGKRPVFVISTEGKTREQMKAGLKAALAAAGMLDTDEPPDEPGTK